MTPQCAFPEQATTTRPSRCVRAVASASPRRTATVLPHHVVHAATARSCSPASAGHLLDELRARRLLERAVHRDGRGRRRRRPGHHRPVRCCRPATWPPARCACSSARWPTCRSRGSPPRCSVRWPRRSRSPTAATGHDAGRPHRSAAGHVQRADHRRRARHRARPGAGPARRRPSTAARCCSPRWPRSAVSSAASSRSRCPVRWCSSPPTRRDPNAGSLLVNPKGSPADPGADYLNADPAVGEVRRCQRNVAAAGATADVRQGLCTRSDASGRYDFVRLMRTGKYLVYAPMNNVEDASSQVALDHTLRTFSVLTTVGQQSNLDLALVRFGAIVGSMRTPDPANGTDFVDVDGVTVTATFCQQTSPTSTDGLPCPADRAADLHAAARAACRSARTARTASTGCPPPGSTRRRTSPSPATSSASTRPASPTRSAIVSAPALNEERLLDVVMLPQPTQVRITPFWTNADGGTAQMPAGATVTVSGIVDYTTSPLAPVLRLGHPDRCPTARSTPGRRRSSPARSPSPSSPRASPRPPRRSRWSRRRRTRTSSSTSTRRASGRRSSTARLSMTPTPRTVSGTLEVTCCNEPLPPNNVSNLPIIQPAARLRLAAGAAARRHRHRRRPRRSPRR